MSTEYDNKVVSMKFDNSNFEKNASKTMQTLNALKEKLKFDKEKNGFNNINDSAKKVNFTPMASAVEAVKVKFSAMEVVAITTLANITNQAVNTGKSMVKALTVDPLIGGMKEYETQINAVQTILANTSSKGTTIDEVNKALDELNLYADKTIYNFTEMTRNIGTFTAAGIDLKRSTEAIQGIANLAATSGSTAEQASTAMYQLSQALASGTVKLMDWNSVVNAGMGGEVFQNALKDTARKHGVAIDKMIKKEGSFRETLKDGWLTSEILTKTLKNFTTSGVNEYLAENSTLSKEAIANIRKESKSYDEAAKAVAEKSKLSQEEIKNLIRMSQVAEDAATKVKTFSQLKDTVKEAISSGWAQTWRTLIGDFEEARTLFTEVSDVIGGIISKSSNARNKLLEDSMTSSWEKLQKKALNAGIATDVLKQSLIDTAKAHGVSIDEMIDKEGSFEKTLKNKWMSTDILAESINKATGTKAGEMHKLSDEVYKANSEMNGLVGTMDKLSGRELLIESFKNVMTSLGRVVGATGKAWRNVFPKTTAEQLYNFTVKLNEMSKNLMISKGSADKLRRTFQGLFAIVNIFTTVTTGALKFALKLLGNLFGIVDLDILGFTAAIGDAAVGLNKFLFVNNPVAKAVKKLGPIFSGAGNKIRSMYAEFKQTPFAVKSMEIISEAAYGFKMAMKTGFGAVAETISNVIKNLKSMDKITFEDIKKALKEVRESIFKNLLDASENTSKGVTTAVEVMREAFYRFQENVKERLDLTGTSLEKFADRVKEISSAIRDRFGFGEILGAGIGVGTFVILKKFLGLIGKIKSPTEAFIALMGNLGGVFTEYQKKLQAERIKALAISIAILAGSLFILSKIPTDKLLPATLALAGLASVMIGMSIAMNKLSKVAEGTGKSSISIVAFGLSLLLMVTAIKKITELPENKIASALLVLGTLMLGILAVSKVLSANEGTVIKGSGTLIAFAIALNIMVIAFNAAGNIDSHKIGKALMFMLYAVSMLVLIMAVAGKVGKFSGASVLISVIALKLLIDVLKDLAEINTGKIERGMSSILNVIVLFIVLAKVISRAGPNAAKAGLGILLIVTSLRLIIGCIEILGTMKPSTLQKGLSSVSIIFTLFGVIVALSKFSGQNAIKAGIMIVTMTAALAGITALMVVLGQMDPARLAKALAAIVILEAAFAGLIFISQYGAKSGKVQKTLITLTVAIAILSGAVIALSAIDSSGIATAGLAMSMIIGMFAAVIFASKKIGKDYKSLLIMVGVTALLAGIVIILSKIKAGNALKNCIAISILFATLTAAVAILSLLGAKAGIGMLALLGIVAITGLLSIIILSLEKMPVEKTIGIVNSLVILVIGLSVAVGILALAGIGGPAALWGVLSLGALVVEITVLAGIIGFLVDKIPILETFLDKGLPILTKVFTGIGEMIGGMISGFLGKLSGVLPTIGTNLSLFMLNLTGFIIGAKLIDDKAVSGIKGLAGAMLALTGVGILDGITRLLGLGSKDTLGSIGNEMASFGKGYKKFADNVAGIDSGAAKEAAIGGKYIAEMISALPLKDGLLQKVIGKKDGLAAFGLQVAAFGPSLALFGLSVEKLNTKAIQNAAKAGTSLAEMAGTIPNSGGKVAKWLGDNGMTKFGLELVAFGPSLALFATSVKGLVVKDVKNAATAATSMAKMAGEIPNTGGKISKWLGDNGLSKFGSELVSFAPDLKDFGLKVKGLNTESITAAVGSVKELADMAKALPSSGGVLDYWIGKNGLKYYGEQLSSFGKSLSDYSESIKDISASKISDITSEMDGIVGIINILPTQKLFSGKMTLSSLGTELGYLGSGISNMYSKFEDIKAKKLNSIIDDIKELANVAEDAASINVEGIKSFQSFVKTLSTNSANDFANGYEKAKPSMIKTVESFINAAKTAFENKMPSITKAITDPISKIPDKLKNGYTDPFIGAGRVLASSLKAGLDNADIPGSIMTNISNSLTLIRSTYQSYYKVGEYVTDGFAQGLMHGQKASNTAAKKLASAALEGARKRLDVNSPSKEMIKLAAFAVIGFVNRLSDGAKEAAKAGSTMAQASVDSVKSTIMKIYDFMNGEIDINPTITPTIDLTNIESGSKQIGNLLKYDGAMRVAGRIDSVKRQTTEVQNGKYVPGNTKVEYNFSQYNNSPKALSSAEIYRNTKNQFAMLKGVTVPV